MPALVASKVTRHSDTAASASVAATASIRRDDATGALWALKPATRDNRFMVEKNPPARQANHLCVRGHLAGITGEIAAGEARKVAGSPQRLTVWAWLLTFWGLFELAANSFPSTLVGEGGAKRLSHKGRGGPCVRRSNSPTGSPQCWSARRSPPSASSPWRQNPGCARRASARRGLRGRSRGRSRSGRRHGCSRRARCRRP